MGANLITGNLYSPITAAEDSDFQAGIIGNKTQILNVGNNMTLSILDNSTIQCADGVLITKEGRRIQIDNGDVVDWIIPTGTQGETKYFIVGFRLYTSRDSAELCETFVEEVASETDTITENTFRNGATEVYVSLGRVTQEGINLTNVAKLTSVARSMEQESDFADEQQTEINGLVFDTFTNRLEAKTKEQETQYGVTVKDGLDYGTYTISGTATRRVIFDLPVTPTYFFEFSDNPIFLGLPPNMEGVTLEIEIGGMGNLYREWFPITHDNQTIEVNPTSRKKIYITGMRVIVEGLAEVSGVIKPMLTINRNATYADFIPFTGHSARLNENVSEIQELIGQTNISSVADGTLSGAISQINSNLSDKTTPHDLTIIDGSSAWTDVCKWAVKVGTMVYVNFRFDTPSAYSRGNVLGYLKYSDGTSVLPKADLSHISQSIYGSGENNDSYCGFIVNSNGEIINRQATSSGSICMSFAFDTDNYKY